MTFFRQASATVRAGQGQAPSWIVPTLKGSTATVRPLQGLQFFVGSLTVGFTHGLEFLHFSCDGGLGETAIADLDVEMFDQFGMIDHFFSQQRD